LCGKQDKIVKIVGGGNRDFEQGDEFWWAKPNTEPVGSVLVWAAEFNTGDVTRTHSVRGMSTGRWWQAGIWISRWG